MRSNPRIVTLRALAALAALAVAPCQAALLDEHFGVTLQLDTANPNTDPNNGGVTSYHFLYSSFAPTLNTNTANYKVNDWHGGWSTSALGQSTTLTYHGYPTPPGNGDLPSGEEPYDIEAMYFDDDINNLYFAIVTSIPPPPGINETRAGVLVPTGDIAIDLGINTPHSVTDTFRYDYAVDLAHDIRPATERNLTASDFDDYLVGEDLYKLPNTNDNGWYIGTPQNDVPSYGENTLFDPSWSGGRGTFIGDSGDGVNVDYYLYNFAGGLLETRYQTYVIEITIPKDLFGTDLNDVPGQSVGIMFSPGCRNDYQYGQLRLYGDLVPEFASWSHAVLLIALLPFAARLRRPRPGARKGSAQA